MNRPAHGIIPARYASTRFPGKPLALLRGKPMFWHVWRRASLCPRLSSVTLATDDARIAAVAESLAVPCLMTAPGHPSGTDRVHEAAVLLELPEEAVVVNIQSDEPALAPDALSDLLDAFADPAVQAATLAYALTSPPEDPHLVKVVCAHSGDALYFSRAPIPYARDGAPARALGHIGLYAFTMRALSRFVSLPPSPLERTEKLEQLRLLENGIPLRVALTKHRSHGVDTPEDMETVLPVLEQGTLFTVKSPGAGSR
jgi:3-deoxy-manno-octulosonate cytidylyltransferase (CMP-KDO synthetase)